MKDIIQGVPKDCHDIYGCRGKFTGVCDNAIQIGHQAKHGSASKHGPDVWPKKIWNAYMSRMTQALKVCVEPGQLNDAINNVKPKFEEDIQP